MDENLKLKRSLILQSFAPLFFLLLVKNFKISLIELVLKFITGFIHGDMLVFIKVLKHSDFLILVVVGVCIIWLILSIIAYFQFSDFQSMGFEEDDDIEVKSYTTDVGVGFFMTFVLPLLLDNLGELQDLLVFILMITLVIILMWRTNLYYQNPVLTILGYKTFSFEINNPEDIRLKGNQYIGITKKFKGDGIIKYLYIADDVFLVYDKNRG